ncbi:MAG: 9-O-acetylesterase [Ignavibacteriaceae bacterium]|nr:9-O-acetylesterase [Ignavibacteriaceae bacterium]
MYRKFLLLSICITLFSEISPAINNIKLPGIFTNNMVLQREKPIPIWGTYTPGEKITVELNNQAVTTTVDVNGNWKVILPPFSAGGPYQLNIIGHDTLSFTNVLVGEVWICSGQSNMAFSMNEIGDKYDYGKEIAEANNFNIRLFSVEPMTAAKPQPDLQGSGWLVCDSTTVKYFSAVAYFFGKYIYQKIEVPIGLINSSYGGTDIEAWTSAASLSKVKYFNPTLDAIIKFSNNDSTFLQEYFNQKNEWKRSSLNSDPGFPKSGITWKDTTIDLTDWKKIKVPSLWDQDDLVEFNGSVWYRKEIILPNDWLGKDLVLNMGPIDDIDVTWFNGVELGSGELWDKSRQYIVPADAVKSGKNLITIRCIDTGGPGGVWGEADQYYLSNKLGENIPIAGEWLYKKSLSIYEFPKRPISFDNPNCPTVLFNAMISPLIPFAIRGVIWYQGENNTFNALQYRTLFPLMISDWRTNWNQGNFPFYFVQLANYMHSQNEPSEDTWAELREAQLNTLKVENTGMAVAIDIGDSTDIHPKNKREVGYRLSLIALNKTYGFKNPYSGPIYKSYKLEGSKIRIYFNHAEGLKIKDNKILMGFSVAGSDHKFYWANAKIDKNTVLVWSPKVSKPIAVRYAWASNPLCNLYNSFDLPASPFRTDNWEVLTKDFE